MSVTYNNIKLLTWVASTAVTQPGKILMTLFAKSRKADFILALPVMELRQLYVDVSFNIKILNQADIDRGTTLTNNSDTIG